ARSSEYGVTVLSAEETPKKLFHRTSASGMQRILKGGIVPGAKCSGRAHCYFSAYRLDEAIAAGCEFFVTDSDGTLTRSLIPPECIISAVDTSKKDLPLYVAESFEATVTGEPDRSFRAKRDYEEAASSSSAPTKAKAPVLSYTDMQAV
ncbi:kptA, partial [Symbiodinium necroappetens]